MIDFGFRSTRRCPGYLFIRSSLTLQRASTILLRHSPWLDQVGGISALYSNAMPLGRLVPDDGLHLDQVDDARKPLQRRSAPDIGTGWPRRAFIWSKP